MEIIYVRVFCIIRVNSPDFNCFMYDAHFFNIIFQLSVNTIYFRTLIRDTGSFFIYRRILKKDILAVETKISSHLLYARYDNNPTIKLKQKMKAITHKIMLITKNAIPHGRHACCIWLN